MDGRDPMKAKSSDAFGYELDPVAVWVVSVYLQQVEFSARPARGRRRQDVAREISGRMVGFE
jgi:hypothetical protein